LNWKELNQASNFSKGSGQASNFSKGLIQVSSNFRFRQQDFNSTKYLQSWECDKFCVNFIMHKLLSFIHLN